MGPKHIAAGISIVVVLIMLLARRYCSAARRRALPRAGWVGLGLIVLCEALLAWRVRWVTIYFTPLAWTGYLILVDSLVMSLEGTSLFRRAPRQFFALAAWSVPLWLIFEAYNLRLKNWTYVGLPANLLAQDIGCVWSFATIWPAIFETADLVKALGFFCRLGKPRSPSSTFLRRTLAVSGLLCVTVPLLLPAYAGSYLFGLVWAGFALLLDPLNYQWNGKSLLRDWEAGSSRVLWSFLLSGLICGFLWEFWNYWAHTRWVYIFPILQGWKIFEMPAPGFLGFPPFAVECFVMYEFLRTLKAQIAAMAKSPAVLTSSPGDV